MIKQKMDLFQKIIVVDPGKNGVKTLVCDREMNILEIFDFPSKVDKLSKINTTAKYNNTFNNVNSFLIKHEKDTYIVGENAKETDIDIQKINQHHLMCIYSAVGSVVKEVDEKVCLIVGFPSSDFDNDEAVNEYKNLIMGNQNGRISINLNEKDKSFYITSLSVYPEGQCNKLRFKKENKGKVVNIIDIGGQNVNYRQYENNFAKLSFSLDAAGMNLLEQQVLEQLKKVLPVGAYDINTININKAIKNGYISEISTLNGFANTQEFLKIVVDEFIENNIVKPITRKAYGVQLKKKGNVIIFTGGGSVLLKNYLKEYFKDNVEFVNFSEVALWDNCISYLSNYVLDTAKNANGKEREIGKSKFLRILSQDSKLQYLKTKSRAVNSEWWG